MSVFPAVVAVIFILLASVYAVAMLRVISGWDKIPVASTAVTPNSVRCSIVIAARNEEDNIRNLLSDISRQDYPRSLFEIIVVNDHSVDRTVEVISSLRDVVPITLLDLPGSLAGKKRAIDSGITLATGSLVITVDADCRLGRTWLSSIANFQGQNDSSLIICPVDYHGNQTFWGAMQNLEFLSLIGLTAGAAGRGQAFMCNGANLAFKRDVYNRVNDPMRAAVSSGDDVFLLHAIKAIDPGKIAYLKCQDAIALTPPCATLRGFLSQKIRWASKSTLYRDADALFYTLALGGMNIALLTALLLSFFGCQFFIFFLCLLAFKSVLEFWFFRKILPFFGKERFLRHVLLAEVLYMAYFLAVGLLSMIVKPSWKGRKINT